MEGDRPLTAKEKRQEQIKRWQNSATDLECPTYANPKIRVKFDDGAVFLAACSACDLDEVKALLDGGADINFANVDGLTALHQACIDGNLEVVEFLVEHGSEIDQEDNEGWTPLHATASCGFMDIAKYLVDKGANVGAVNSEAELPIDIAEEDEMVDYLQSEIDRQGIDVEEARDIEHIVMLEDAKTLLERHHNGENLELYRHPKSGATPLHITAAKGYNDALKILIKAGLDVNAIDNDGWTPLHAASHWSQEESAKILADKSANFKIRSKLGQTCFDVADEDMLEYLEELEAGQEKDAVIEPPPLKKERKSSPIVTKDPSDSIKINDIQNGEKQPSKTKKDENEESDEEKVSSLKKRTSAHSPYSASTSDAKSSQDKDRQVSIVNDVEDSSDRLSRRRPASLQISATQESSHKPLSATNSEGGSKPVAATQPVQSVTRGIKENGKTPSYTRDKEETPSSWRTGLRKTPSFEEKSKSLLNSKSETERSSSYSSRLIDETKTARVAPILDARKAKESETEDTNANDVSSGYQRTTSFSRKKQITDNIPTITTTDSVMDTTTTYKRSVSYKKAVGRAESLEINDDVREIMSRRPKTISHKPRTDSPLARALNDVEKDGGVREKFQSSDAERSSSLSPSFSRRTRQLREDRHKTENKTKKPIVRRWSIDKELYNIRPVTGTASVFIGTSLLKNFQPISKALERQSSSSPDQTDSPLRGRPLGRQRLRSNSADFVLKPVLTGRSKIFVADQVENPIEKPQSSSVTEDANETTNDNAAAASEAKKNEDAEKRRSHLQPVRDEEAEAQRRIRSRRERQTRRSTQGVTLDVYEEAMKTIGKMKKKPADGDKTDSSSDATKSRNDSSSDILNRDDSQTQSSGTSQSSYSSGTGAGTPVTSLPSSYIPSDQRVKAKEASDAKATGLAVPSITLAPSSDAEEEKGENSTSETGSNTANRKSAAQQRRRTRKERRSTGLPDLKPSISSTEPEIILSEVDEDEEEEGDEEKQTEMKIRNQFVTPKSTPFSSPVKKHFLTPERDLEWLRNLGRVTRGRTAVQSAGKNSNGRRFANKDEFKRKSIECDLHPTALARKKGISPRDLSPVRPITARKPYNGYFTKNSPGSQAESSSFDVRTTASLAECAENDPTPRRRLSYNLNAPLVNPFKKLKAPPRSDKPGSTPPTSEKLLSVKKPSKLVKQLAERFRVESPIINFAARKGGENLSSDLFQFKGGGGDNIVASKTKSAPRNDKGFRHSMLKCKKKVIGTLWPPSNKSDAGLDAVKKKLVFEGLIDNEGNRTRKDESVTTEIYQGKGDGQLHQNPDADEEETPTKEDAVEPAKGERLRQKYDTSSLPSRHDRHRTSVRSSDSDIPPRPPQSQAADDGSYSPRSRITDTQNYKKLYEENQAENERLRTELTEAQKKINELQSRLEKAEENTTRKQALDNEKRERRALEQKLAEMEQQLQNTETAEQLRKANGHLLAENNALHRIVEKLGGNVPTDIRMIIEDNKSSVDNSTSSTYSIHGHKKAESAPDLLKLGRDSKDRIGRENNASPPLSPALSTSSSSSSLSLEDEKVNENRRGSATSLQSSELGSRISRFREGANSSSPASSYSTRRENSRLGSYSSTPSLVTRNASPRRPLTSSYGNTTDYGRSSTYNTSRYTSSRKDPSSSYSTSTYSSLPSSSSSSSKRDYLKSLPPSSGSSSSSSSPRTGSAYRTSPTPYGSSTSKPSYTSSSRSKLGYGSSSTGRTGTSSSSSKLSSLSKYPTSLSSSRRTTKY